MGSMRKSSYAVAIIGSRLARRRMGAQQSEDALETLHVHPNSFQAEIFKTMILNGDQILSGGDRQPDLRHPASAP